MNDVLAQRREVRRELGVTSAVAIAGTLGALPIAASSGSDAPARINAVALLVWLAILAPAGGAFCTSSRVRLLPFAVTVPAAWLALVQLADAFAPRHLATPWWGAAVVAGLFLCGAALGELVPRPAAAAGALALLSAALIALPGVAGLAWSPRAAARLLELSPATWVCESAGLDWMRHPSVYDPVGSDRFERTAWSGALAGPLALVVGCAASWIAARVAVARRARSG